MKPKPRNTTDTDIAIGLGEILWDLLPDGKRLGGAPGNFAYHMSQFGIDARVVSAIGDDSLGKEIIGSLDEVGLQHHIAVVDFPTGTVRVELDSNGVPRYEITENVAWDHIPFTESLNELATRTKAVCFGSLAQRGKESRSLIHRFLNAIPAGNNPLIVFDANLRQNFFSAEILADSINRCNVLKINNEELPTVVKLLGYRQDNMLKMSRFILERHNLSILILTCGVDGSYVLTPDNTSFLPTPQVEIADTVGAGDSFTAAFIASILNGKSVREAHIKAVEVSAFVCTQAGAMPQLPTQLIGEQATH